MKDTACAALAELRSAFVDGALADADRERVVTHLAGCPSCRREVADLHRVRRLLNRAGPDQRALPEADDLSTRLVSIAGVDAFSPVWSRPFRRTAAGALPSGRRTVRKRTAVAAVAFATLVATVGGIGYAAAPQPTAAISDPSDRARSEFAAALAQFPLSSRSVEAVMMAPQSALASNAGPTRPMGAVRSTASRITPEAASAAVQRATAESTSLSYSGEQNVQASNGGQNLSATVRVVFEVGQGSETDVFSPAGQRVVRGFVAAPSASRMVDDDWLALLKENYLLTGWGGGSVSGRPATVVEATPRVSPSRASVAARWWIDDATGLLLWQETYDAAGRVLLSSGFRRLNVGSTFMDHLAPRLSVSTTTASLTLSHAPDLVSRGWFCSDELAGLSLVRLRSDEATNPGALHMIYSDGISTLSVFEQRGKLSKSPLGVERDTGLGAYVRIGTPSQATWQSGDTVFSVVTDGSADLLRAAVAELPHSGPMRRTTMERVRAGWLRIVDWVIG